MKIAYNRKKKLKTLSEEVNAYNKKLMLEKHLEEE